MFQRVVEGCLRRRVSYFDTSDDIYPFVVHRLDQHAETSQPRGFNMRDSIRQRVQALGLTLPTPSQPIANYINHVVSRNQLFISGQIPLLDGKPAYVGRLGESLSEEDGAQATELAALGLLAQLSDALGDDLSRLVRTLRLGVFIACSGDFQRQSVVANGASNLLVNVLGDKGRHVRTAVGVSSLPGGVAVEVDAVFELQP
jgi:enamine deaminase RidA (YjgF/YER057c/UK114 family)